MPDEVKNDKNHSSDTKALEKNDAGEKNQIKKEERKHYKYLSLIVWSIIGAGVIIFIASSYATGHGSYVKTVFYDVLINNILAVPSILVGLIVFIGYMLQKKAWYEALSGAFKGIVGYLVLQMGSAFLTGISKPLMTTFGSLIGSKVVLLDTYTGWSEVNEMLGTAVSIISYVVLVGLATNIFLVALKKITNVRSINVTGHIMFQQSSCLVAVMYFLVFRDVANESTKQGLVILASGICIGFYWGVFSNLAYGPTQHVTKNAGFSIGHQQMLGVWLAYQSGKLFALKGKEVKTVEELKLKKGFRIFHDNIFSSTILMLIFFGTLFLVLRLTDSSAWDKMISSMGAYNFFGAQHWIVQILGLCVSVVASIQILMIGARMFVAELQKSFLGISQKLIPGAAVAIDIAGSFSYGEKAVTFGFLAGAIGNFIGIGLVILLGQVAHLNALNVIIMVGFIPMFFDNAALGLYANATGGWKACLVIPFIGGILIVFGAVLVVKVTGIYTYGYNGMFDWTTLWSLIMSFLGGIHSPAMMYLTILVPIVFLLVALLTTTEPGKSTPLKHLIFKKWVDNDNKKAAEMLVAKQKAVTKAAKK